MITLSFKTGTAFAAIKRDVFQKVYNEMGGDVPRTAAALGVGRHCVRSVIGCPAAPAHRPRKNKKAQSV